MNRYKLQFEVLLLFDKVLTLRKQVNWRNMEGDFYPAGGGGGGFLLLNSVLRQMRKNYPYYCEIARARLYRKLGLDRVCCKSLNSDMNHFRSAVFDIPWYQYYPLDVIVLLITVVTSTALLAKSLKIYMCGLMSKRERNEKQKSKRD